MTDSSQKFTGSYLAKSFIEYYESRGHSVRPSASLVPDDPTLLFTAAGMVPFKEYYSVPDKAPFPTACSVQKCLRAGGKQSDLENVGRTLRHHTFFEMLGNFSFGDYFKKEAIESAWDLSVNTWGLDKERIWVSVYLDDDEAWNLWTQHIGVPESRMVRLGKSDNFWGPVGDTGVCGPSSELYFDTGEQRGTAGGTGKPGDDDERFIEFWNLVFPQFYYTPAGVYDPLPRPGIDTGMGLERIAFLLQNVQDNFHTDIFLPIREAVRKGLQSPGEGEKFELALNAAADHVRALTFAMADGVMPSNDGRGYVLRRLLRRAHTKMHPFGVRGPVLAPAVDTVVAQMADRYPELKQRAGMVKKMIAAEEEHFLSTIELGWSRLQEILEDGRKKKSGVSGKDAFVLYDTFGFPFELTKEIAHDEGLAVDEAGYTKAMSAQKERSRKKATFYADAGAAEARVDFVSTTDRSAAVTEFLGYEHLETTSEVVAVRAAGDGRIEAVTERTTFYPEGGGQVGDTGVATAGDTRFTVHDTRKIDRRIAHLLAFDQDGAAEDFFRAHAGVNLAVDRERRYATMRNHTATHLLHAALREVLGDHVAQKGSLVAPDRLRFDFHHFQPVTASELQAIERRVNETIVSDLAVTWQTMPYKEAIVQGAMALFGEKYGDEVRMVSIDGFSKELCAGTHLRRSGEVGPFILRQETSVAAGIRRVEALTGYGALDYVTRVLQERNLMAHELKVSPDEVGERMQTLIAENDKLKRQARQRDAQEATDELGSALAKAEDIGGVKFVTFSTRLGDLDALRKGADLLRGKMDKGVALLGLEADKKPMVLVVVSDGLIKSGGPNANDITKRIGEAFAVRGGGKPHMAQFGLTSDADFPKISAFVRDLLVQI